MISDEKEKFKRVRVLCREDSLRDVLAVLLSGNFKSEVPAAKNEAALDFRRVEGDDPYEKPIKRLSSVAKYAGWKYTLPEKSRICRRTLTLKPKRYTINTRSLNAISSCSLSKERSARRAKTNSPVQRPPRRYSSSYRVRIRQGALRPYAEGLS